MTEISPRDSVIALLRRLEGEDDADVLSAARELNAKIAEMGVPWDELLVPDDNTPPQPVRYGESGISPEHDEGEGEGDDDIGDDGGTGDAATAGESSFEPVGETAEDISRIEQIKAMPGISDSLREELDGFLEDIKENEFTASDRLYLQALQQRLAKRGRKEK